MAYIASLSWVCPFPSPELACRRFRAWPAKPAPERLFRYSDIGSLTAEEAHGARATPVEDKGGRWDQTPSSRSLQTLRATRTSCRIRQAGLERRRGRQDHVDGRRGRHSAIDDLDRGFFRARIDKTTDAERDYLRAMAALGGPGPYRSGEVSRHLGKKATQTGPVRDSLIKRGLCYAPRHGDLAFTVPTFDEFIRRTL